MSYRIRRRDRMCLAPGTRHQGHDRHLPAIAAATARVRPAARRHTQPALASCTPYSDRDSAEGAAPLRREERQDPECDQPQCDQDERPRTERATGERAERSVHALGLGRIIGDSRVQGGDPDAGEDDRARNGLCVPRTTSTDLTSRKLSIALGA